MTLYLKYRSKNLDELDSAGVRESLKRIVSQDNIPHALLFSGPKGTGKTSAARILAKVVNCENPKKDKEPCNVCSQCSSISKGENLDVIELDAASHRGIDDVRALRDAVKLAPAKAKKKIYIIDEAHMLTLEASNALLKTLEEPPDHVMFILATTNPEKLIETIRSRTTNIIFSKAADAEIVRSLTRVAKGEDLKFDESGLEAIARQADGSFRDAIKLLEQLSLGDKTINKENVEELLYSNKEFQVEPFLKILSEKNTKTALAVIEKAVDRGLSGKSMANLILLRLREALMAKLGISGNDLSYFDKEELVSLIKVMSNVLSQVPSAVIEQLPLEIAVVEWGSANLSKSTEDDKELKVEVKVDKKISVKGSYEENKKKVSEEKEEKSNKYPESDGNGDANLENGVWARVLNELRPKNASTEALLRASKPLNYDGKILTLGVYYRFHKERLEGNPHRDILEDVIETIMGSRVRVVCTLTEPPEKKIINSPEFQPEKSDTPKEVVLTESEDEDIIKVAKEVFGS